MSQTVNMGDKVNAGTSSSGAITVYHQQNIFTSDANITTVAKKFVITSPLIDAYTCPVVSVMLVSADTALVCTLTYGGVVPTTETLTNDAAAVITPGTFTFYAVMTTTTTSAAPNFGVSFL